MSVEDFMNCEPAQSFRRIGFDSAEVVSNFPGSYILVVSGEAPCLNMEVSLSPLVYAMCPEYWGIEVIGALPGGICLTAMKPYTLTLKLDGITGYRGIEVLGARRGQRIDVEGGCGQDRAFT
jgi:hypothetical protein